MSYICGLRSISVGHHWSRKGLYLPLSLCCCLRIRPQQFLRCHGENLQIERLIALKGRQAGPQKGAVWEGTRQKHAKSFSTTAELLPWGRLGGLDPGEASLPRSSAFSLGLFSPFASFPPHPGRQVISRASWQPPPGTVAREPAAGLQLL